MDDIITIEAKFDVRFTKWPAHYSASIYYVGRHVAYVVIDKVTYDAKDADYVLWHWMRELYETVG